MSRSLGCVFLLLCLIAGCSGEPEGARAVPVSRGRDAFPAADAKAITVPGKAIATH